ncbi:carbon storage regulator [Zhongshania marina]|uniref:Carbon storage regulator n=1 Tax=Zhongshania marina TaxID=2304603 RepID=A0A2S4HG90_9GAMM|nr:carbon storage regulator [Marortus luteolus]POP52987.1 carbon storage regulator [Marortus luteolus]
MLTITRRSGESFQIDEDIVVHIRQINGGQVRVSIDAPEWVKVLRSELLDSEDDRQSDG